MNPRIRLLLAAAVALSAPVTIAQAASAAMRSHATSTVRVGRALTGSEVARIERPVGRRVSAGTTAGVQTSTNWSGLAATGSGFEGASGSWVVPTVAQDGGDGIVSQWVGVDGDGNESLIQTGTAEDELGDTAAWFELLPEDPYAVDLNNAPVNPGDAMTASVSETSTSGVWLVYLADTTEDWYFEQTMSYAGPLTSAEWIVEAPTVLGSISALAPYGTTTFTQTSVYGDFGTSGTTWYGTSMDASNEIDMVDNSGDVISSPSAPIADATVGQDFTMTYETPPPPPELPTPTMLSPTNNVQLSTVLHIAYRATDAQSPVTSYTVRYSKAPWNSSNFGPYLYPPVWQDTTVTHQTLVGVPGEEYCVSMRATDKAGGVSDWTQDECAAIPIGAQSLPTVAPHQWVKRRAPGYYLDTYAETTTAGAELRLVGGWGRIDVVATRCPTCGTLQVWVNGALASQFNLHAATVQHSHVFLVRNLPYQKQTVILKTVGTKSVIVEGVGFQ